MAALFGEQWPSGCRSPVPSRPIQIQRGADPCSGVGFSEPAEPGLGWRRGRAREGGARVGSASPEWAGEAERSRDRGARRALRPGARGGGRPSSPWAAWRAAPVALAREGLAGGPGWVSPGGEEGGRGPAPFLQMEREGGSKRRAETRSGSDWKIFSVAAAALSGGGGPSGGAEQERRGGRSASAGVGGPRRPRSRAKGEPCNGNRGWGGVAEPGEEGTSRLRSGKESGGGGTPGPGTSPGSCRDRPASKRRLPLPSRATFHQPASAPSVSRRCQSENPQSLCGSGKQLSCQLTRKQNPAFVPAAAQPKVQRPAGGGRRCPEAAAAEGRATELALQSWQPFVGAELGWSTWVLSPDSGWAPVPDWEPSGQPPLVTFSKGVQRTAKATILRRPIWDQAPLDSVGHLPQTVGAQKSLSRWQD